LDRCARLLRCDYEVEFHAQMLRGFRNFHLEKQIVY